MPGQISCLWDLLRGVTLKLCTYLTTSFPSLPVLSFFLSFFLWLIHSFIHSLTWLIFHIDIVLGMTITVDSDNYNGIPLRGKVLSIDTNYVQLLCSNGSKILLPSHSVYGRAIWIESAGTWCMFLMYLVYHFTIHETQDRTYIVK